MNEREQLGDIATGGPMALNIISSESDIILNFQSRLQIISAPFPRFVLKGINYKEEICIWLT